MTKPQTALFGPTGQIGHSILSALLKAEYPVLQIISPGSESRAIPNTISSTLLSTQTIDLASTSREELASVLVGVYAVISALNGKGLEAQRFIQDAAADAGVRRFFPSEFGMHHIYRPPGDVFGFIHPVWNIKSQSTEKVVLHPSILAGKMTYTIINCGDFYNQPREKTWCPWTQPASEVDEYRIPILGDAEAQVDFTHIDDFATFLVESLARPEISENQTLSFVSDRCSFEHIAKLLERFTGKKVVRHVMPLEVVHRVIRDPANVPKELGYGPQENKSAFPVDFWFLIRAIQGEGRFILRPGEVSNGLFPGVKVTTLEDYLGVDCP